MWFVICNKHGEVARREFYESADLMMMRHIANNDCWCGITKLTFWKGIVDIEILSFIKKLNAYSNQQHRDLT